MKSAPITMEPLLVFAWVALFLLIGVILRAKVSFFRKYLIPACILGGVTGFVANSLDLFSFLGLGVQTQSFHIFIYHLFNLTWIFLGLQRPADNRNTGQAAVRRQFWTAGVMMSITSLCFIIVILGGLLLQNTGDNAPASLGLLNVLGFNNGPGQALTIAAIWENNTDFLTGVKSFALAGSSLGYLVAVIVGIPILRYFAKLKNIPCVASPTTVEQIGIYAAGQGPASGQQTTHPTSLDTLSFHVALGFVLYLVVLCFFKVLENFAPPGLMQTVWGLFFVISMGAGMLARKILNVAGVQFICCRNTMTRLNGLLVDFLACATFISIQVGSVMHFWKPFVVSALLVTVVTTLGCWYFYRNEEFDAVQRFAVIYGTMTGTISTGMVLLRMVDPDNKSTAAIELGVAAFIQTPFIAFYMASCHWEILSHQSATNIIWAHLVALTLAVGVILLCRTKKAELQVSTVNDGA
ncbi:MAG: hypothetical protein ACK5PS_05235 [Desulfopila sp.]